MKTKFGFGILIPIYIALIFGGIPGFLSYMSIIESKPFPWEAFPLIFALVLVSIWIIFGEIAQKTYRVRLYDHYLSCRPYLGLGKRRKYTYRELSGFKEGKIPNRYKDYGVLVIYKNEEKVAKITGLYCRNYTTFKTNLQKKIPCIGTEDVTFRSELKDVGIKI